MKTQMKKELVSKTIIELKKLIKEAGEEIFKLKLDLVQNKLQNTGSLFLKKKELAVLQTFLKMKEKEEKHK